jgi:hypothetical protein
MKRQTTRPDTEAAYRNSQFNFKPTRDPSDGIDRRIKSRDKVAYDKKERFNISYPSYVKYLEICEKRKVKPLDYRSYKNLVKKTNIEIVNYMLTKMKSFKLTGLGVINVMYKEKVGNPDIVQNKVRVLSLKFHKTLSNYIRRYSFVNSNYIKRLISYLDITRKHDFTQKDFIMINSKL